MLSGEKILVTGATSQIGRPLAEFLARENEVWGVARLRRDDARDQLVAAGITPLALELSSGDYGALPGDFTFVVHMAAFLGTGTDFDKATRINAEGTGRLLHHCRRAKAALVMSTHSVYAANSDPFFVYNEGAPRGESHLEQFPTYSMSKIGQEAVARSSARTLGLPVLIARMNASYGPNGGFPPTSSTRSSPARRWSPASIPAPTASSTKTTSTTRPGRCSRQHRCRRGS